MKGLFKKLETMMVAASFAEEGEFDTARSILKQDQARKIDRPSAHDYQRLSVSPTLMAD